MARQLRVEDPGALYHVMNRGDRREPMFKDDEDRQRFLLTLGETCAKTGWQVHACPEYLKPPSQRLNGLRVDRRLGELRIPKDSPAGREQFERVMKERRHGDEPGEGEAGPAAAGGNDDDVGLDCRAVEDGDVRLRGCLPTPTIERERDSTNAHLRDRPLYDPFTTENLG